MPGLMINNRRKDNRRGRKFSGWPTREARDAYTRSKKDWKRDYDLRRNFGITANEYDEMVKDQGGVCAICGKPPKVKRLGVDHDHRGGPGNRTTVRGALCMRCNKTLIGQRNDPAIFIRAAEYLKQPRRFQ